MNIFFHQLFLPKYLSKKYVALCFLLRAHLAFCLQISAFTGIFEEASSKGLTLAVLPISLTKTTKQFSKDPPFINTAILVNQITWRENWLHKQTKISEREEQKWKNLDSFSVTNLVISQFNLARNHLYYWHIPISANSFRGNYSFLNLALCTVTFDST